jgi:hypothetical protein
MQIGYIRVSKNDTSQVFDLLFMLWRKLELILIEFTKSKQPEEKIIDRVYPLTCLTSFLRSSSLLDEPF